MRKGERGPFSPKLRVRIKDNISSPHGKFYRFLFPFSRKFSDLNSEPGLPVMVQNPPCWRASSLLFPHLDIKTKRPEPVKLDLPLF